ncbi:adenylate/guanylate cyclase domain-containing protein, partial [Mycobacterium sp. ITM-2017-0098]
MAAEAIEMGRIRAFVRWVARTPWPVFTLGMLQADIIGALLVLGFLRFGLPPEDRIQLQDLPAFNLAIFLAYLFVSFTVASYLTLRMLIPVMRWQRRDMLLGDRDPADTEVARMRALKMPFYRSLISATNWLLGSVVFIVASWPVASKSAP